MSSSIGSVRERRGAAGIEPSVVVRRVAAENTNKLFGSLGPPGGRTRDDDGTSNRMREEE